jgi:hypothetical protein
LIKIAHIITDLDVGGAEMMLYKLLSHMDQQRFMNMVISLKPMGPLGAKIRSLGIPVFDLGMRRGIITPTGFLRLAKLVLSWKPTIIQTWLYHADLIGFLVAKVTGTLSVAAYGPLASATGASFSGVTVMVTVATLLSVVPSLAL